MRLFRAARPFSKKVPEKVFSQNEVDKIFSPDMLRSIFAQKKTLDQQNEVKYSNTKNKKKSEGIQEQILDQKLREKVDQEKNLYDFRVLKRKLDIEEKVYFEIIRQKTASLIAAACSAGVASVTEDSEVVEQFRLFGEYAGIAFQIKDDLFDYGTTDVGKPLGIDIKEQKMTLPLIHVLEKSNKTQKRWAKNIVKRHHKDKQKVNELIHYVKDQGGLEYATSKMHTYKNMALDILKTIPQNDSTLALKQLVAYSIDRKK